MNYKSTRGSKELLKSTEAVLQGLAHDGGLFMPVAPDYSAFDWKKLMSMTTMEMSETILAFFLDDFDDMKSIVKRAYDGKFDTEELTPVVKVGDRYVLELFHGPTSAFKDVALSVLPVLMSEAKKAVGEEKKIMILTATSGDTGKAAMEGFSDVPGIDILVFFPDGGVSPVQKLQMTTQKGGNVCATAVKGNFDDAQTGVKKIFSEVAKNGLPEGTEAVLSSANSINIGRLVPQIVYYFKAYAELLKEGAVKEGDLVDYTVPTGNFGDILAGYFAKKLGLPVGTLICASNANNILTDFLSTGVYDKRRDFFRTVSPSMDILVSSNLERLLYLMADEDEAFVADLMMKLNTEGIYTVPADLLAKLKADFACGCTDDVQTKATIKKVWEENGYLIDTHTAVAWNVASEFMAEAEEKRPNVVLSTASAYKFPAAVADSIGVELTDDEFELMARIEEKTGTAAPKNLSGLREREVRFSDVIEKDAMFDYVVGKINE